MPDIVAGDIQIATANGAIPGYCARPAGAGPFPVVVTMGEIHGIAYFQKSFCERLARSGYFAATADTFFRQGDVTVLETNPQKLEIVNRKPDSEMETDLDATLAWVKGHAEADVKRAGLVGFCWGGRQVWLQAARTDAFKAGVTFYGAPLVGATDALHPRAPIDVVGELKVPVLAICGGTDYLMPSAHVDAMRQAIERARKPSELFVYPDTPHGFMTPHAPAYRAEPAADAWERMLAWLRGHGAA